MQAVREDLARASHQALQAGGADRIAKQLSQGKLTARQRVLAFLDPGTFQERDALVEHTCFNFGMQEKKLYGDGVVTGSGLVFGRPVYVYSQDFTVFGGSLGLTHAAKIVKVMKEALQVGAPVVGLHDSGGARIQEGVQALAGYADVFQCNVEASGVVPQIALILGPCAGGAVYSPALMDFTFMTKGPSCMFLTGPDVVESVTGERDNDLDALAHTRALLSYLPSSNNEEPPSYGCTDPANRSTRNLESLIPASSEEPYDMKTVVLSVADNGEFFEIAADFARNMLTGFARIEGRTVGIVANQPAQLAGVLDSASSRKAARFVTFCDAFRIPLLTFVDVPGFLPGVAQEHGGVITHGAKLLYAYAMATVPKVTVITRKAYGGAYCVMSSKHLKGDINLAWPSAEVAVMGAGAATKIIFRGDDASVQERERQQYVKNFYTPLAVARFGYVDDVIQPAETRHKVATALQRLQTKRAVMPPRKQGNIPL